MKKIAILIAMAMCSLPIFAATKDVDVIELKNGNIIKGVVVENIPNKTIKIEKNDKSIIIYKYDEVKKITTEKIEYKEDPSYLKRQVQGTAVAVVGVVLAILLIGIVL